jgi:hypothetical protein
LCVRARRRRCGGHRRPRRRGAAGLARFRLECLGGVGARLDGHDGKAEGFDPQRQQRRPASELGRNLRCQGLSGDQNLAQGETLHPAAHGDQHLVDQPLAEPRRILAGIDLLGV